MYLREETENHLLPQVCAIPHATGERMGTDKELRKEGSRTVDTLHHFRMS